MEFGTKKSAVLTIKEDTTLKNIGIELPSYQVWKLQEGKCYKHLGKLVPDKFLAERMKVKVSSKIFRQRRKFLKTNLNDANLV